MRSLLCPLALGVGCLLGVCYVSRVGAADSQAANLIERAVDAEIRGDRQAKTTLLNDAKLQAPDDARINSLLGNIQDKRHGWLSLEQSLESISQNRVYDLYEEKRASAKDTVASQWELAQWCKQNDLPDLQRIHLNNILRLDTDHRNARHELGYRRLSSRWASPDEVRQVEIAARSLATYGKQLENIVSHLQSSVPGVVQRASERLHRIDDALAIPAAVSIFGNQPDNVADDGLRWLAKRDSQEAAIALCQFALYHPSFDIRDQASNHLSQRDLYAFVPWMMDRIASPFVPLDATFSFGPDGSLRGLQQRFLQEGDAFDLVHVHTTEAALIGASANLDRSATSAAVRADISLAGQEAQELVEDNNTLTQTINQRASRILEKATDNEFAGDAKAMRLWWSRYNDRYYDSARPVLTSHSYRTVTSQPTVVANVSATAFSEAETISIGECECLVYESLVMTRHGLRKIGEIKQGDVVLSVNVSSGQLQWKPVLEVTRRAKSPLKKLTMDDESIQCTPGHFFWVSGRGWRKAGDLMAGDVLHTIRGLSEVSNVIDGATEETFNLVVADNGNYFVGRQMILSHDFTARSFTDVIVPGVRVLAAK